MKGFTRFVLAGALLLVPGLALAGSAAPVNVPTMGEAGLVTFAAGLVGGGLVLLRRRKR